MYDIRQFKPALYLLIALGFTGFALAAETPGLWLLSMTAITLNAWLVKTHRFTPIPHWLANIITFVALLLMAAPLREDVTRAVLVIGEFLVALQIVKLYEQRGNRDLAQLLVLSLLLMVAASINTASLLFGVMLVGYLFLSLYCCLLFHLKVETDSAKAASGLPEDVVSPVRLRQDQRFLSRSMRRLTFAVSSVAIAMAVLVFLFFPRGTGAGLLGPLQPRPSETLTGFSDSVSFQRIAEISQNSAEIAYVKLWKDGKLVRGTEPLLLRGLTLDCYTGEQTTPGPARTWRRTADDHTCDAQIDQDFRVAPLAPRWKQQITLYQTGTPTLFAMPGVVRIEDMSVDVRPRYSPTDEVLQSSDIPTQKVTYTVESTGMIRAIPHELPASPSTDPEERSLQAMVPPPEVSQYDAKIEEFARRPEVSGVDAQGPLAARRQKSALNDPLDAIIAGHICSYLQHNFTYTLDLSDAAGIGDRDPIVAFLYDLKRGHCEYFASAMTLMCQSLGMQARVVVGFKCDEYNTLLSQYIVKQNMAHAWVEVESPDGQWLTFDPTAGRGSDQVKSTTGLWHRTVQLFQFLEYTWADSVVAYDHDSRANLINNVNRSITSTADNSTATYNRLLSWIAKNLNMDSFASSATPLLVIALSLTLVGAIGFYLQERWRMHRRARRIGLIDLPTSDQLRLVRQLGFYDDLLRLLERHKITRPPHLTPLEFSRSIEYLPHEVFDIVNRLTEIFYRVRYGSYQLSLAQRRHLAVVIGKLTQSMQGEQ